MEDLEYYERQRVENERRSDLVAERKFWASVLLTQLGEDGVKLDRAVEDADLALKIYRERFS